MKRIETRIDRELVERVRERARREGRDESELIEDALRSYLDRDDRRASISKSLENARRRREAAGIPELSEEEAMRIAVEEQHAYRRGE
jgi:metal-responsive CopG/Arc/MetJ family transcriptional regulator